MNGWALKVWFREFEKAWNKSFPAADLLLVPFDWEHRTHGELKGLQFSIYRSEAFVDRTGRHG